MRITNQMSTNRMLLNVNKNATKVDTLYSQISTGKKILFPSDNPIIASRALKFRTNISETEQYMRNAAQATSWMSVTEEGFSNTLSLLESIRTRLVQGATDTLTASDRDKIVTEMSAFADQIGGEMNISYAGRYVFSGFRTDHPPILTRDYPSDVFTITQKLQSGDVQNTKAYIKDSSTDMPEVYEIAKIDLPYRQLVDEYGTVTRSVTVDSFAGYAVTTISPGDPLYADRYNPDLPPGYDVFYLPETGELILSDAVAQAVRANNTGTDITYTVNGLKSGELNPVVYFDCVDNTDPANPKAYTMDAQSLKFEFGVNTQIQINSLGKDSYTAVLYAELMNFIDTVSNIQLSPESELRALYTGLGYTDDALEQQIQEHITAETKLFTDYLNESFSNMLGRFDDHTGTVTREYTTLGSRMNRIELTSYRLEENRVSFTSLMSENENVDYLEAIMNLTASESVYSASMNVGARISQMTLADYIR